MLSPDWAVREGDWTWVTQADEDAVWTAVNGLGTPFYGWSVQPATY